MNLDRNTILAIVLAGLVILIGWEYFFAPKRAAADGAADPVAASAPGNTGSRRRSEPAAASAVGADSS